MNLFLLGTLLKRIELLGKLQEGVGSEGVWPGVILAVIERDQSNCSARWHLDVRDIGVRYYLVIGL